MEVFARVHLGAGDVTEFRLCPQAETGSIPLEEMWPVSLPVERYEADGIHCARTKTEVRYDKPGVYFAACRTASNRNGNPE